VSLTLSSNDLVRVETALTTLLSPLRYERLDQWRSAVRAAIEPLVGADKSTSVLHMEGEPLIQCDAADAPAYRDYMEYYIRLDTGFHVKRRELGLEVSHGGMLYDSATIFRSELYNDWVVRHGMLQPMAMAVDLPASPFPAVLSFHRGKESGLNAYEREMGILRLLLPAFKAGIFTCCQLAQHRAELAALVDRLPGAISVYDARGRLVHESSALAPLLSHEPQASRVRAEVESTGVLVAALGSRMRSKVRVPTIAEPAQRELQTAGAHYVIRGSYVGQDLLPVPGVVIVWVETIGSSPLGGDEAGSHYGLTRRESQVAALMREGRSNAQVARMLGFTIHTARRHSERVLSKLEVHSRAEAAAKLNARRVVSEVTESG
jgi:DNA-binding CsgD family transcriptional regulator